SPWGGARVGGVGELLLDERGQHIARANRVDRDAALGALEGDGLGQTGDAVLGRDISRFKRRGDQSMSRGDVDDAPPAPLLHRRKRVANSVERSDEVDGDDGVPLFDRKLLDRRYVLDADIVYVDV